MIKKHLPNILTAARVPLAVAMLFVKTLSWAFLTLYLLCGLTDILDGFFARKFGVQSRLGARLDSAADLVLIAVLIWKLWPVIAPGTGIIVWIAAVAAVRFAAAITARLRFGIFGFLHTWGNKLSGFLIILYPVVLRLTTARWVLYVILIVSTVSALEELFIELSAESWEPDRKGLFF